MTAAPKIILQRSERRSESPDPIDIHVGQRLRLRRNLLGMSQEQLGKASGLTFQQIQKYERGTNRMGASRLYQLGRLLNVDVAFFFEDMVAQSPASSQGVANTEQSQLEGAQDIDKNILQSREIMQLVRAYNRITDPKQRRTIYDLIKSMADDKTSK